MTDTLILKTLTEEKSRIIAENKINGKNLVLTITTKNGEKLTFKPNSAGQFAKEPELLNGALKIGILDIANISKTINDVDGVVSETVTEPYCFSYIDPESISTMSWSFDVIKTQPVNTSNLNEDESQTTNEGE